MNLKNILSILFFMIAALPGISQTSDFIRVINAKLVKGEITISEVLSDTTFMQLHSLTPFREVIKQNAKPSKIKLNSDIEPGVKISINGIILDKYGNPVINKLVYVYQTSSKGWYSDTAAHILMHEGDRRHARLFGYFKTDSYGKFEFYTIRPKGYPNTNLPAHIHIEISLNSGQTFVSELQFDDDPRLVGEIRAHSITEKFFIVKNMGTNEHPVYSYQIQIPY
jgi:protocatechuate 3,4-dioxygenase beta subunit